MADGQPVSRACTMPLTTYIWGCIFYMLGSICFVIGTGFYLADGIRVAQAK